MFLFCFFVLLWVSKSPSVYVHTCCVSTKYGLDFELMTCILTLMNCSCIILMQIGNCVGAANHRHFIALLISVVTSTFYISIMTVYVCWHIWPSITYEPFDNSYGFGSDFAMRAIREIVYGLLKSVVLLSPRGLVLVYLFVSSVSLGIGLSILLWQQLCFIYEGKTYLNHLNDGVGEKDCQNLVQFFGCPYSFSIYLPHCSLSRFLPSFRKKTQRHKK